MRQSQLSRQKWKIAKTTDDRFNWCLPFCDKLKAVTCSQIDSGRKFNLRLRLNINFAIDFFVFGSPFFTPRWFYLDQMELRWSALACMCLSYQTTESNSLFNFHQAVSFYFFQEKIQWLFSQRFIDFFFAFLCLMPSAGSNEVRTNHFFCFFASSSMLLIFFDFLWLFVVSSHFSLMQYLCCRHWSLSNDSIDDERDWAGRDEQQEQCN